MKKKIILLTLFTLLVMGCDLESEHNLGNGYFLLGNGANTTISKVDSNKSSQYTDVILGEIADYNFDENYIIVLRNASEEAKVYFNLQDSLWLQQKGINPVQYWIISKNKGEIYGPLNKQEYANMRKNLKISDKIKLADTI